MRPNSYTWSVHDPVRLLGDPSSNARVRSTMRCSGLVLMGLAALALAACPKDGTTLQDAGAKETSASVDLSVLKRAEDQRRVQDVPELLRTSHDPVVRRGTARALARIADTPSAELLLQLLSDEDFEVAAWAAYGLGRACKGHEENHVRALVARSAKLGDAESGAPGADAAASAAGIDVRTAIARAIGRCGAPSSEPVLAAWVRARGAWAERAVYALGDLAGRRGALTEETMTSLLDAAVGSEAAPPLDVAIYPLGRLERAPDAFVSRAIVAARAIFARPPSPARLFAARALGRTSKDAVPELVRVVTDTSFAVSDREEAARSLGRLGEAGQAGVGACLARLVPDKDPFAIAALGGDEFGVMSALVTALGADLSKKAEPALYALAHLDGPGAVPEPLARRLADLRCGAALSLARGAFEADVLKKCDAEGSEAWEKARLAALVRRPLVGERRAAWKALAQSKSVRVKEDAIEAFSLHAELGDVGRAALADALASKHAGVVAAAAAVVQAHPDRVMVLAEREKRAALDPAAPPPTTHPARDIDTAVAKALGDALRFGWAEDLVETRANLLDAAAAVALPGARETAMVACRDPNLTIRDRAAKALRSLGEVSPVCGPPDKPAPLAAEVDHSLSKSARVVFQTDAGELAIRFDPEFAPVTTTRIVELARAGFFKGIVIHRVVPGFVVQFGDPGGDGYGGAGKLLRDETSPVAFGALDVGIALAGRDTGSSQLFVTLARYPHLDGEYARVGHAEGDWAAVAQGDVVRDARVEE